MEIIDLHPQNPQKNRLNRIVAIIDNGGVMAYPTDSGYALACDMNNKKGLEQICRIRQVAKTHLFTMMLNDIKNISRYAIVDNQSFRLLKRVLPGAYTFIFLASKQVPNRLVFKKRKTIGIRIPSLIITQAILQTFQKPLMSVSLKLLQEIDNIHDIIKHLNNQVDLIVDGGFCPLQPTTVIDLVEKPILVRQGLANSDFLN